MIYMVVPLAVLALLMPEGTDPLPLLISMFTYCGPAAFISGWRNSLQRRSLAGTVFHSRAGAASLIVPELVLPFFAGMIPALLLTLLWNGGSLNLPWQIWTVIAFSSVTAICLTVLLERLAGLAGKLLNLFVFCLQALPAVRDLPAPVQLLIPHGYVLWTLRWFRGAENTLHGDIYAFFAVLIGVGLLVLTVPYLSEPVYSLKKEP